MFNFWIGRHQEARDSLGRGINQYGTHSWPEIINWTRGKIELRFGDALLIQSFEHLAFRYVTINFCEHEYSITYGTYSWAFFREAPEARPSDGFRSQ